MVKSNIRVGMFTNLYPPVVSGSSIQSASLSHELVQRGCSVVVITAKINNNDKGYELVEGVHVYRLPAFRLPQTAISLNFPWLNFTFTLANQRRIFDIIKKHRIQLLHVHNHMFDLAFSAVIASKRFRLPLILTIHTIIRHPNNFYNLLLYPADRILLNFSVIKHVDKIICPDRTTSDYMKDVFKKNNYSIIPYGINILSKANKKTIKNIRTKYNLYKRKIILSIGHLHEIRNRKDLVKSMPTILQQFPNAVLLIVGSVGTNETEELAKRLGVEKSVIFTGSVPHSDLSSYLEISDIEAHWFQKGNPQTKTLGIAALEAMGAGKTVVNSADENVYGHGILENNKNIVLIDVGNINQIADTIIKLLGNRELIRTIGKNARETIQNHFSWNSATEKTVQLYHDAIEESTIRY